MTLCLVFTAWFPNNDPLFVGLCFGFYVCILVLVWCCYCAANCTRLCPSLVTFRPKLASSALNILSRSKNGSANTTRLASTLLRRVALATTSRGRFRRRSSTLSSKAWRIGHEVDKSLPRCIIMCCTRSPPVEHTKYHVRCLLTIENLHRPRGASCGGDADPISLWIY